MSLHCLPQCGLPPVNTTDPPTLIPASLPASLWPHPCSALPGLNTGVQSTLQKMPRGWQCPWLLYSQVMIRFLSTQILITSMNVTVFIFIINFHKGSSPTWHTLIISPFLWSEVQHNSADPVLWLSSHKTEFRVSAVSVILSEHSAGEGSPSKLRGCWQKSVLCDLLGWGASVSGWWLAGCCLGSLASLKPMRETWCSCHSC